MQGWIKLHRKIRLNPVFNNLHLFRLWVICLTEATHKPYDQLVGNQMVKLEPGQFVTGRFDLEQMYNRGLPDDQQKSPKTIWRWLTLLQQSDFLTIKSTNKYSVVSITNWPLYQFDDQQNDQQVTNKRPTSDQQVTTNKNVKNDKNDKKKDTSRKPVYEDESPYLRMVDYLIKKITEWLPSFQMKGNKQTWADEFRKLHELDNRSKESIKDVIDWATSDSFWQGNILSAKKLREKFDQLQAQMNRKGTRHGKGQGNGNGDIDRLIQESRKLEW